MKIKTDSRKISKGDTFVALKNQHDGHEYIEDAIKRGATKIIAESGFYSVNTLIVEDTHEYLVNYLKDNYWEEIKNLKIIGMTGTNGKTTTCYLLHKVLNHLDLKCAYIGTIGFYIDEKIKDLSNTTPDILEIYEMLLYAKESGCSYVVMEVSSHALALDRVKGIEFDCAIFSNLTEDHLDYHQNMENYLKEKKKLFSMLRNDKLSILNSDSTYFNDFINDENSVISYGFTKCDYQVTDYHSSLTGSYFVINDLDYYETKLIGKHNIYNLLCIILFLKKLEINEEKIKEEIKLLECPKGRMDRIDYKENLIIVDYAHTPDAVENVINCVKDLHPNHIYTIIGCGGNRDKKKRPIMGNCASRNSDYVIFTSDNPRFEEPMCIINDMIEGVDTNNFEVEINRQKAIVRGIQLLDKNDILLVLGKGHETYQIIGDKKIDMDDKEIILRSI